MARPSRENEQILGLNASDRHQDKDDCHLLEMWLDGKAALTREYYDRTARELIAFVGKPIRAIEEADLVNWANTLNGYAKSTQATRINAARSLFSFVSDIGYIRHNVGRMLRPPTVKDSLHERLLSPAQVHRIVDSEGDLRNQTLLRTLYITGCRVSELCQISWRDFSRRGKNTALTIFGKGGKTRRIAIPSQLWVNLKQLPDSNTLEGPVFRTTNGAPLSRHQVYYIVRKAVIRTGINKPVSPHWLRHAHASHALDNGAAPHLVKDTLGHASLSTTTRYAHSPPESSSAFYLEA